MKLQITAQAYHLGYLRDEDRLMLSASVPPDREFGVLLTRRLTRFLLEALAKIASERGRAPTVADPALRDTILDFQHSQAVANAVAQGSMRDEQRKPALSAPAKLMHQVTIVPKPGGALALVFDDPELALTVDIAPERLHMVIETFVRIAERAGWDFPPMAGWLDPAKQEAGSAGRPLN